MKKYINDSGKEAYKGITLESPFDSNLFHLVEYSFEWDEQHALHTNLGSITVLNRMTGCGYRDVETGFRNEQGEFWLASCFDVRSLKPKTIGEAIEAIKKNANTCIPDEIKK